MTVTAIPAPPTRESARPRRGNARATVSRSAAYGCERDGGAAGTVAAVRRGPTRTRADVRMATNRRPRRVAGTGAFARDVPGAGAGHGPGAAAIDGRVGLSTRSLPWPAAETRRSDDDLRNAPNGIRTRVAALKGRSPRPLDDGDRAGDITETATRFGARKRPGAQSTSVGELRARWQQWFG